MIRYLLIFTTLFIVACSSSDEPNYLPDGGPSAASLYQGDFSGVEGDAAGATSQTKAYYMTKPLRTTASSMSYRSDDKLKELHEDFRLIPNPEVVGYVMPHFAEGENPVPGYFTVFKLYEKEHYAKAGEGYHE